MIKDRWFVIGTLGLIVILMMVVAVAGYAQERGFSESFEDPALPGWERSPGSLVVDGVLRVKPNGFALRPEPWGDSSIRMRARLEGQGQLMISYRVSADGEYALQLGRNEAVLQRSGKQIARESFETIPSGEWFFMEIFDLGGQHEFILNGQPVLVVIDEAPLPPGGIALSALGDAVGEYDDLNVMPLGDQPAREIPGEPPPEAVPTYDAGGGGSPPDSGDSRTLPGLSWVRTGGPPGGIGYDIRYKFDEHNTWYVTDNFAGVHRSTDDGLTWWPVNEGIPGQLGPSSDWKPVFSLTVDPHNPDTIWAGTDKTGHIYKSTDGGETWIQKDDGVVRLSDTFDALSFRGFTVDPVASDVVYAMGEIAATAAGGAQVWSNAIGGVIYKTTDGGENWQLLWDGAIPSSLARYMWVNPQDTDILYVSTGIFDRGAVNELAETEPNPYGGLGILKSTDGGATWRVLNVSNGLNFLYISSLFMHPEDPDILLAATGKYETEGYMAYLEENNLQTPMGVYRTVDGGESWLQVLPGGGGFTAVEICPSDPDIAYAASGNTVYHSEDAGETWTQVAGQGGGGWGPPGVLAGTPIDMQCDPEDTDRIFTNNYLGGNFLSEDGGFTWRHASDGYTGAPIVSVAVDPSNPARIFAGGRAGLWTSDDGGGSWSGMRYPPVGQPVWGGEWGAVAIDPKDPLHLLASEETIWESFDRGKSWAIRQTPAPAHAATIAFAASDPNIVFTGRADPTCILNADAPCRSGHGVYISRDGGTTWDFANDSNISDLMVLDLAVDPQDADTVYIATMSGVFVTTDAGASWNEVAGLPAGTRTNAISVHPQDPLQLMAGVEGQGLYYSSDGGDTWSSIAAGLQPNSSIRDFIFDPIDPQIVYLSDLLSGVYRSEDGGQTWLQINAGLSTRSATGLGISLDGNHVYVATSGEGVFRLDVDGQPPDSSGETGAPEMSVPEVMPAEELPPFISAEESIRDWSSMLFGIGIGVALAGLVAIAYVLIRRRSKG